MDLGARRILSSLPSLVRYLRREQPAAVLSVLHANVVALWARRLAGVSTRLVVSERNTLSLESSYTLDLRVRLAPFLAKCFYPWADGIVAVSSSVADDLAEVAGIPHERIRVIYNPVVTMDLEAKAKATLEHPWFHPGEPPVILAAGRLTAQKDFETLIRAFARVLEGRPSRLLILGEGEMRPALESLVDQLGLTQDVSLPGFVANPYPYMSQASVFVLSSRWEGLPGVLIEALYCGVPLIATDCPGGSREILVDGRYGQLVPVGDADALAKAIEGTLEDERPQFTPESWGRFELDTVVGQYLDVLLDN